MTDSDGMIEPAHPAHAAAMALIHAASFPPREQWGADAIALQLGLHGGFGLIDRRGGMLLARHVADEAEILTVAVVPELRRQGVGFSLLQRAAAQAAEAGARILFLEVSTTNAAAQALYTRCGFTQVGLRRRYYADGSDALILTRNIISDATTGA